MPRELSSFAGTKSTTGVSCISSLALGRTLSNSVPAGPCSLLQAQRPYLRPTALRLRSLPLHFVRSSSCHRCKAGGTADQQTSSVENVGEYPGEEQLGSDEEYTEVEEEYFSDDAVRQDAVVSPEIAQAVAEQESSESTYLQEQASEGQVGVPPPGSEFDPEDLESLTMVESAVGWVWSAAILCAIKLGREASESSRGDYDKLLRMRDASRAEQYELERKRKEYEEKEAARKATEATARLESAKRKAEELERERREREHQQAEAARVEAEALAARQEAARKEYEAKEAAARAEMERRTEIERKIREEEAAKARAEAERKRREEAERKAREAEERRRRYEEEERLRREEAARRREEKRRLRQLQATFAVRLEGSAAVSRPPQGAMTDERIPREATVSVEASASTLAGGPGPSRLGTYAGVPHAVEGAVLLACQAARGAAELYVSAVRMQKLTDEGVLMSMGEVELQHWMHLAVAKAGVAGAAATRTALKGYGSDGRTRQQTFQARTERGVLPEDHPQRADRQVRRAIAAVEADDFDAAEAALRDVLEDDQQALAQDCEAPLPEHTGTALTLAFLLDLMYAERPARQIEASPWFVKATGFAKAVLSERVADAALDSLGPLEVVVRGVLGGEHPLAQAVAQLAEANLSAATRKEREKEKKMMEARLAAHIMEQEWPDVAQLTADRIAAQEAAVPVPEKVWALRNVAATLALGGAGERSQARKLLEKAVLLKQEYLGDALHPGMLPELDALGELLEREPEWAADAAGVRSRMLRILSGVAERYFQAGRGAESVVLLEAANRSYEEVLGMGHRGVAALSKRARQLLDTLDEGEAEQVAQKRREPRKTMDTILQAFTEDIEVYKKGGVGTSKARDWDEGALLPPLL